MDIRVSIDSRSYYMHAVAACSSTDTREQRSAAALTASPMAYLKGTGCGNGRTPPWRDAKKIFGTILVQICLSCFNSAKTGQLILSKIDKIVATRCHRFYGKNAPNSTSAWIPL